MCVRVCVYVSSHSIISLLLGIVFCVLAYSFVVLSMYCVESCYFIILVVCLFQCLFTFIGEFGEEEERKRARTGDEEWRGKMKIGY